MADILTLVAVKTAQESAKIALHAADEALKRMDEEQRSEVNQMLDALDAASKAIGGLAHVREGLLTAATVCDLSNSAECKALLSALDGYLRNNSLRSRLKRAINRLSKCRKNLVDTEGKLLQRFSFGRRKRKAALEKAFSLLERLSEFIRALSNSGIINEEPSGLGWWELKKIEDALKIRKLNENQAQIDLDGAVKKARADIRNTVWHELLEQIDDLSNELNKTFR